MFTYLEFCRIFSFLFFFSLLGGHNTLIENARLISDKTKINYCIFPCGQVFSLGICLTRLNTPRSANSLKEMLFLFSQCSLRSMTLEFLFFFFTHPKLCLPSPTNKGPLVSLRSLKNDMLAFGGFILRH